MEKDGHGPKRAIKSMWLPEMDRLLLVGMKHGPAGIQLVTQRLRQLSPTLTPGEIWGRMRHLRENGSNGHRDPSRWPPELIQLLRDGYTSGGAKKKEALKICRSHYPGVPSYVISRFARQQGWLLSAPRTVTQKTHRAWSESEDQLLWRLAGYESPQHIAHKLRRTESAVRCRLKAQGLSGRVKDGISLRAFQEMFHIGHRKAYALIARGMLRVRDARISTASMVALRKQRDATHKLFGVGSSNAGRSNGTNGLSWERAASSLEAPLDQVRIWLARRQLRVVDTFVTEKALEEFCQSCGRSGGLKLNYRLLDPKVLQWLKDYGVTIPTLGTNLSVSGSVKHALVARVCGKCSKRICGNAYFVHIKGCKGAVGGDQKASGSREGNALVCAKSTYRPVL
jgi:hypothetical protein